MLAERHGARFLQASGAEVYGDPWQHPQREHCLGHVDCSGPRAWREEGKRAEEALCFDMLRMGRVDVRVARIFDTYGPRMRHGGGVIPSFVVQALRGQPIPIHGSGRQTRSFCYVSDLVRGLLGLMDVGETPERPVNLGNPQEIAVRDLAHVVQLHTGAVQLVHEPRPAAGPRRRRPDISAARRLLGWRPVVGLSEGLELTVRHFRQALYAQALSVRDETLLSPRPETTLRRVMMPSRRRPLADPALPRGTADEPAC